MAGNRVRTPGVSRKRTAFDSSTLFHLARSTSGEVVCLSSRRDGIDTRTRHRVAFVQPAQDAWFSAMKRGFESRKRHDALAGGTGADATNVGSMRFDSSRGPSTPARSG